MAQIFIKGLNPKFRNCSPLMAAACLMQISGAFLSISFSVFRLSPLTWNYKSQSSGKVRQHTQCKIISIGRLRHGDQGRCQDLGEFGVWWGESLDKCWYLDSSSDSTSVHVYIHACSFPRPPIWWWGGGERCPGGQDPLPASASAVVFLKAKITTTLSPELHLAKYFHL